MAVHVVRVYEDRSLRRGRSFLVERLWPRGVRRDPEVTWLRDVAPSTGLRRWFGHDPERWDRFRERYLAELRDNEAALGPLMEAARSGEVTLLYGARDVEHNSAVVLAEDLRRRLGH